MSDTYFELLSPEKRAMKFSFTSLTLFAMARMPVAIFAMATGMAQAQMLAQEPLLSKTVAVRPNVTFILDESGSMNWPCIYKQNVKTSFAGNPYGDLVNCINAPMMVYGVQDNFTSNNFGQLTGGLADFRYTSPENNTLMYDPRKTYGTGFGANGNPKPLGNEAWPALQNGTANFGGGVTTTGYAIYLARTGFNVNAAITAAALNNAANYDTYWVLSNGRFALQPAGAALASLSTTINPLPKPPNRIDCLDASATPRCSFAEEQQNIRNWSLYHRNRLRAAKVGVTSAFNGLPDTFRMNYLTLGDASRNQNPPTVPTVMNNYANVTNAFSGWVDGMTTANGVGTPLRQTLDVVGRYYDNNKSNTGPWGTAPWAPPAGETAAAHLSCRRSFAIMTTDGLWNDGGFSNYALTNAAVDTDGTIGGGNPAAAPALVHALGKLSYTYTPHDTSDPRNRGKADNTSGAGNKATLADTALYYWSKDLRTDLVNNVTDGQSNSPAFWQNLSTYTIGFGVNGTLTQAEIANARLGRAKWPQPIANTDTAVDDMIHAAHNGGGEFLGVTDATEFAVGLRKILLSVTGETARQSGVAVSATTLSIGNKKIVPNYTTGEWWGNVSAINLDSQTAADGATAWNVTALDSNNRPTGFSTIPSPVTRNLWVQVDNTIKAIEFKSVNLATNSLIGAGSEQLNPAFNSASLVDFIRGDRLLEGDGQPYRARTALLGDIVNSRPAFVKDTIDRLSTYSNLPAAVGGSLYSAYKATKAARTEGAIFVGANDGMLHAFAENDGRELFAFIPRSVLKNLHLLADKNYPILHKFYVDGPMKEADAYIQAPGLGGSGSTLRWANLLLGTTGAGAKSVFALDVTKPLSMQGRHVLWEVSNQDTTNFAELGSVLSDVETGVTPSGNWIAAFGNGYDSKSGKASLFLVDLATGTKIRELTAGTATANGLGGVRLVRNANSQVIGAYAGDLLGNVWRFDLSGNSSSNWQNGQLLFSAKTPTPAKAQPITAAPAVFKRTDGRTGNIVVVGTGRMLSSADADLTLGADMQSAYGLWDTADFGGTATFSTISGRAVLAVSTSSNTTTTATGGVNFFTVQTPQPVDWATQRGWVLDYTLQTGQRSIYPIEPLYSLVRIDTIVPKTSTNSCSIVDEVKAFNYLLDPINGVCKASPTIDINGDNKVDASDGNSCVYSGLGDGSNAALEKGDGKVFIVGATDHRLIDPNPPCVGAACPCDPLTDPNQCRNPQSIFNRARDVRQIFIRP
jgi:type IV pilus assembly protein PilY1